MFQILVGMLVVLVSIPLVREVYYFFRWRASLGRRDEMEWTRWLQTARTSGENPNITH